MNQQEIIVIVMIIYYEWKKIRLESNEQKKTYRKESSWNIYREKK